MEINQEMREYYTRVRATDRDKMGNYVLMFLAEKSDEWRTVRGDLRELAYESGLNEDYFYEYITEFHRSGLITTSFAYNHTKERFECEQIVLHGPWDRYNRTGVPFAEYDRHCLFALDFMPEWVSEMQERGF